jgi:hypothetical protein
MQGFRLWWKGLRLGRWVRRVAEPSSISAIIDKQELIRNKVLEAKSLCGSDTIDVSVRSRFEGKIFGFCAKSKRFSIHQIIATLLQGVRPTPLASYCKCA